MVLLLMAAALANPPEIKVESPYPDGKCPGFERPNVTREAADLLYAERAAAVIRAAQAGRQHDLASLVAPDATFEIWHGDYSTVGRERGIAAIIAMVGVMKPVSFQSTSDVSGPVSVSPIQCLWTTTLLFRTADPARAVRVEFEFVDGRLTKAIGHDVAIVEGALG